MNLLRSVLQRSTLNKISSLNLQQFTSIRMYHGLFKILGNSQPSNRHESVLLAPQSVLKIPLCGFKFRDVVRKRCSDCYIVVKDRQQIVLCKTHPRHKQKQKMPKEKDTWIITHRTTGVRPW